MDYGSVCSGIEAATVAWHPLGWKPVWFSEIEPFPCKVLKHHYPNVPNLGNMLLLTENETFNNVTIDLLVGGTPCQSFSIAGLRGGLTDDRGNLALQYCRLLYKKRQQGKPVKWFLWENVPGVFSSFSDETNSSEMEGIGPEHGQCITETADFATLLEAFRECGYCCAYRVLDAQYFGVPQRRRRVFVVGYFGDDWRPPATVLFERPSLQRHIEEGRKSGQIVAALTKTGVGTCGADDNQAQAGHLIAFGGNNCSGQINVAAALKKGNNKLDFESETFILQIGHSQQNGIGITNEGVAYTLDNSGPNQAIFAYPYNQITSKENRSNPQPGDPCPTITKRDYAPLLIPHVRRLTPVECERLQGFPDNYTLVPGSSDTTRYQSIGNSMAVPVMEWIGKRIDIVDKYLQSCK